MINSEIGPRESYTNLQITISPATQPGAKAYRIRSEVVHWRYFGEQALILDIDQLRGMLADPSGYGVALGKTLFSTEGIGPCYAECLAVGQSRDDGLRVRLEVEPPELQELLWERLYQPVEGNWLPLGSTATTPFSRYIRPREWKRPAPVTERPLRLLLVIASPSNLSDYGLDAIAPEERQWIRHALEQLPDLAVTILESGTPQAPTLNEIRRQLANGFHLVHFLCHGAHQAAGTALFLEDEQGQVDPVEQARLVEAFRVLKTPPVGCFLAACESAQRDRHDAWLPLGPSLVAEGGLQAAVAMTGKVGLRIAQVFAGQFYARLLQHGVVDLAVNEARALVQDDWDWGVPVLFTRLEDNQLIDFPVGKQYRNYLTHTDQAFQAVDEALEAARIEDHGQQLVDDLEMLVKELSKSHGVLVEINSKYRRTGRDPQTFAQNFESFYFDFKDYYDGETWLDENASCRRIRELGSRILPKLSPLLKPASFDQLRHELEILGDADLDLVRSFRSYLDTLNQAVETVWAGVKAGKIVEAIAAKQDFEDKIGPGMQISKDMFQRMSHGIGTVSKA
jgi:hypothetical protein